MSRGRSQGRKYRNDMTKSNGEKKKKSMREEEISQKALPENDEKWNQIGNTGQSEKCLEDFQSNIKVS